MVPKILQHITAPFLLNEKVVKLFPKMKHILFIAASMQLLPQKIL
jgi:hypothetical protein